MQTITRKSIKFSKKFYDYFSNLGIPCGYFMVKKVPNEERPTLEQLKSLLDYIFNKRNSLIHTFSTVNFAENMMFEKTGFPITHCGAGITSISVLPNGDVYPCVKMNQKKFKMGSLLTSRGIEKFKESRKNIIMEELVHYKSSCNKCDIKYICGGGCRADEEYLKEMDSFNKQCSYFYFAIEYFLEKWSL